MKPKIIKVKDDYFNKDECSIGDNECGGLDCLKRCKFEYSRCRKCQCFYCTHGKCINLQEHK